MECYRAMMIAERYCSRTISDSRRKSLNSEFCSYAVSIRLKPLPTKTLKLHKEKSCISTIHHYRAVWVRVQEKPGNS